MAHVKPVSIPGQERVAKKLAALSGLDQVFSVIQVSRQQKLR